MKPSLASCATTAAEASETDDGPFHCTGSGMGNAMESSSAWSPKWKVALSTWLITSQPLKQLWTLVHNTSAVKDISSAGFILQQQKKGGLTFVPKRANILQMHLMQSKWRQTPTKLLELGYQFFGNCFCETIYGMGVWSQSCWSGQIPTHFLTISLKEH